MLFLFNINSWLDSAIDAIVYEFEVKGTEKQDPGIDEAIRTS
jgi:hypothetical protein